MKIINEFFHLYVDCKQWLSPQAGLVLLRLYTSILFPVVVVASWMFALYAALSYAVPNKLCSNALRSNAVRPQPYPDQRQMMYVSWRSRSSLMPGAAI